MKKLLVILCAVSAVSLVLSDPTIAQEPAEGGTPSIEGTYMLVSRDLPDGSKVEPPEIGGMITFTENYRNFNVYWKDEDGKPVSLSSVSKYTLADDTYSEKCLYHRAENMGDNSGYDFEGKTGSAPIEVSDGTVKIDLPLFDEPKCEFSAEGFTATLEGAFVDHWKRVK
jgi:hypothetical protein